MQGTETRLTWVVALSVQLVFGCGSRKGEHLTGPSAGGTSGQSGAGGSGGSAGLGGTGGAGGTAGARPGWCDTEDGSEILRDDRAEVRDVTLDATHLYFTHHNPDVSIYRMKLEAGSEVETVYRFPGSLFGFELHDQDVWWLVHPSATRDDPYASKLYRGNKSGEPPQIVIERGVRAIAAATPGLVILRLPEPRPLGVYATFELVPWSGGTPTRICDISESGAFTTNDTAVVWIDTDAIHRCPLSGGAATQLVDLPDTALSTGLGVDSTHVYWRLDSLYQRMALDGGMPEFVHDVPEHAGAAIGFSTGILLDGDQLLYGLNRSMLSVPKTGGTPVEILPKQNRGLTFFTFDRTHYYWGEGDPFNLVCIKRKPR